MVSSENTNIRKALGISAQLNLLADQAEMESEDDGCRVLYGVIRDCAYKIRQRAEYEREMHRRLGTWDMTK